MAAAGAKRKRGGGFISAPADDLCESALPRKRPTTVTGPHVANGHLRHFAPQQLSLNHFVGATEQAKRKYQTEHLCRFKIDSQFDLGGLYYRQVGRFFAL
jgi:hypothetical protein